MLKGVRVQISLWTLINSQRKLAAFFAKILKNTRKKSLLRRNSGIVQEKRVLIISAPLMIIIDGRGNRGQACRRGRNAASSPTLNSSGVRRFEGYWTCTGSRKPSLLSIADFRLLRTHVVLVHASIARGIIKILLVFQKTHGKILWLCQDFQEQYLHHLHGRGEY